MRSELAAGNRRRTTLGGIAVTALAASLATGVATSPQALAAGTGTISTITGSDSFGDFTGDGGPAVAAAINEPAGVAAMPGGGYLFADAGNDRVRRVFPDGTINTVAGSGPYGDSGDGGPATAAKFKDPLGVAVMPDGGYLVADAGAARIRRVSPAGTITTVAGTGTPGYSGDGGAAAAAQLSAPSGVAAMPDGGFLIADTGNSRVREVFANGTIKTVAGTGTPGFSGDGGPATAAQLGQNSPYAVAVTADGGFLIGDEVNRRVRRVSATGIITTVAGTGVQGSSGDGGTATAAQLNTPMGVAATPDGGFLITDFFGDRVRWVSPAGVISTVAGTGKLSVFRNGDGGPATAANIDMPFGVASTPSGGFVFSEEGNAAIRFVDAGFATAGPPPAMTAPGAPTIGSARSGTAGGAVTATANWNSPADNGGSPITGYVIRALRLSATGSVLATATSATQPGSARQLTMTLQAGNYRFTVQASNKTGLGPQSDRSNLVVAR